MSGLFGSLNNSVKALNAQTRGLETAGRNLANVNNANYARQRVVFGDRGVVITPSGPASLGLEALSTMHLRDSMMDTQVSREMSLTAKLETMQSALDTAQAGLGQSISSSSSDSASTTQGLAENLTAFFNAFTSLAAKPTDVGERQTLIQKAHIMAERLNLSDARLEQSQSDLSASVVTDVASANDILATIGELNGQISRFEINFPGGAVDLRDQRQAKLEELAKIMDFKTRADTTYEGQIVVYTTDSGGTESILVQNEDHATLGTDATVSNVTSTGVPSGAAVNLSITTGSIAGALEARDTTIQDMRDQLDAIAAQLVSSVNGAYGANFFVSGGTTAGTIDVDSAITASTLTAGTGTSGDNSIALAVASLATEVFDSVSGDYIDGTFSQYYDKSVSGLGQALSSVSARLSDQKTIQQLVVSQRDSVSGVSLDEEMADLMKYQRAFQANSRVVSTINDLLDNIVNQMGR